MSESGIDRGVEYDAQLAMWHAWYGYRQRWFRQRASAEAWLRGQTK